MTPIPANFDFRGKARSEMIRHGFKPDFSPQVMAEVNAINAAATGAGNCRDLRQLLWSSIDNNDSRDLDQIEWAEQLPDGNIRVLVGVAERFGDGPERLRERHISLYRRPGFPDAPRQAFDRPDFPRPEC
jgi:hypothetical protein